MKISIRLVIHQAKIISSYEIFNNFTSSVIFLTNPGYCDYYSHLITNKVKAIVPVRSLDVETVTGN